MINYEDETVEETIQSEYQDILHIKEIIFTHLQMMLKKEPISEKQMEGIKIDLSIIEQSIDDIISVQASVIRNRHDKDHFDFSDMDKMYSFKKLGE
jgi:hypothetical protein